MIVRRIPSIPSSILLSCISMNMISPHKITTFDDLALLCEGRNYFINVTFRILNSLPWAESLQV